MNRLFTRFLTVFALAAPLALTLPARAAEQCYTQQDMDAATRSGIEAAVQQFFTDAVQGNSAAMQQNAIPNVAQNFQSIAGAVTENKDKIAGGQAHIRNEWLLDAPGTQTYERAEFFCGLVNAPGSTSFVIPGLPPGKYAVAIQDITGSKQPLTITYVLQQEGPQWKLAGYFPKEHQIGPHDGLWYWVQARDLKKKGDQHTSYFYYVTAANLIAPAPFVNTAQIEKLYEEQQAAMPKDVPQNPQQPAALTLNGTTYQIVQAFPVTDPKGGLDLVYKYSTPDISDTGKTFQQNMAFIKALVAQYPEYKQAFSAIVARAVAPSGQDFGTMLPVSEIK